MVLPLVKYGSSRKYNIKNVAEIRAISKYRQVCCKLDADLMPAGSVAMITKAIMMDKIKTIMASKIRANIRLEALAKAYLVLEFSLVLIDGSTVDITTYIS
jgi:hypothetical protein